MNKKSEKRLCWNCEGDVSLHSTQCPYCGVDLTQAPRGEKTAFKEFASPFKNAGQNKDFNQPPYSSLFSSDFAVSQEEWNDALEKNPSQEEENESSVETKREIIAFFLFLPGIVFCLFGLILLLFSQDGVLTLQWNQNLGLFYFLGAMPFLFLGWRALK